MGKQEFTYTLDYKVFKELLEQREAITQAVESAAFAETDEEKKKHWAEVSSLEKQWKDLYAKLIEGENNTFEASILFAYKIITDFSYLDESKLIRALNALDVEVVGYAEN